MAAYLLFTPDAVEIADVKALRGLRTESDPELKPVVLTSKGPGGHNGRLWYFHDEDRPETWPHLVFNEDEQEWIEGDGFWLGINRQKPPTPFDLARANPLPYAGHHSRLADGQLWQIPNGMQLPFVFRRKPSGEVIESRSHETQSLYDQTVKGFDIAMELYRDDVPITTENAESIGDYCGRILMQNYRVTPWICWLLGLWDPATLWNALCLTTDFERINRLIKEHEEATETDRPLADGGPSTGSG